MVRTSAQKWESTIKEYRKKCQAILNLAENIRYAGVINSYGRTLSGIVRPGITPALDHKQAKNEFFIIPTLMNMRKDLSHALGTLEYVLLSHKKIPILVLQKNSVTYYIALKKDSDIMNHIELISKIKKII